MATVVEGLALQLSADVRRLQKDLQKTYNLVDRTAKQIEKRFREANKEVSKVFDNIGSSGLGRGLAGPLAGLAAAVSVREITQYADAWTRAGNQIAAAGEIAGRAGRSLEGIMDIANRTRSGFTEIAQLYARLLRASAGVARSEEEVAKATEITAKAFKAGGAASSEMAAGILQLSQGLGSGVLQGDELRSVRENAPLLAQAIADYFKTTVAGLKKLGEEGKLTSDKVFQAILAAQPKVEAAFGATNQTIEEGFIRVRNALTQYIGQTDDSLSATQRLSVGLNALADDFDRIADTTLKLASVIAAALVGRSIAGMIVKLGVATAAVAKFIAAIRSAATVTGLVSAVGGLSAVAGPLGAVIGGTVVGALMLFADESAKASEGAKVFAAALKQVEKSANDAGSAVEQAGRKSIQAQREALAAGIAEGQRLVREELEKTLRVWEMWSNLPTAGGPIFPPDLVTELRKIQEGLAEGTISADEAREALKRLSQVDIRGGEIANQLNPIIDKIEQLLPAVRLLRDELSNLGGSGFASPRASGAEDASMAAYEDMKSQAEAYIADAMRRNSLSRQALALEQEIARVRNDAIKAGVVLTEQQVRMIATANLAANERRANEGRKTSVDDAAREAEQIQRVIDNLRFEQEQLQRNELEKQIYNELRAAGVTLASEEGREIAKLVTGNYLLAKAQDRAKEAQEAWNASMMALGDIGVDVMFDIASGARNAADALEDLARQLIKAVLQASILGSGPLAGLLGTSSGGGLLGGLLPNAHGNVFAGGRLQAFAKGGVVKGPTIFPMARGAGLMGEAGHEAVMPLARLSNGDLGVKVAGRGNAPQTNIVIHNAPPHQREERQNETGGTDVVINFLKGEVAKDMSNPKTGIGRSLQSMGGWPLMNKR